MKTIYLTKWENNEEYDQYEWGIGTAYSTRKLAENAIKMLEEAQAKRLQAGIENIVYSWTIQEMIVYDFVAPMGDEEDEIDC